MFRFFSFEKDNCDSLKSILAAVLVLIEMYVRLRGSTLQKSLSTIQRMKITILSKLDSSIQKISDYFIILTKWQFSSTRGLFASLEPLSIYASGVV